MAETEYRKYWIGRVNRGEAGSAPAEVFASGALQGLVRDIPGAIGVVKTSDVKSAMKVLKVEAACQVNQDTASGKTTPPIQV
jgi:hypothetical protein